MTILFLKVKSNTAVTICFISFVRRHIKAIKFMDLKLLVSVINLDLLFNIFSTEYIFLAPYFRRVTSSFNNIRTFFFFRLKGETIINQFCKILLSECHFQSCQIKGWFRGALLSADTCQHNCRLMDGVNARESVVFLEVHGKYVRYFESYRAGYLGKSQEKKKTNYFC